MIDASKMSFEEWMKAKEAEDKEITHGAERVPYDTDAALYHLEGELLRVCFRDKMRFINLYFIPDALNNGSLGLYGYQRIMISKPYWKTHGVDEETISTMFHELCHAWDAIKGKKDTDGSFHNDAFRETCVLHGGLADYTNHEDGYNDAHPTEETMKKIKSALKEWTKKK